MTLRKSIKTAVVVVFGFVLNLNAQVPVEALENSSVNWQQRVVQAKGIANPSPVGGRAGQIRAARADALRQILETVEGMVLTSETTVQDFMLANDRIRTEVRGVCRNFREVGEPIYMSDKSIELNVEMILGPEFNDVLIGDLAYQDGTPVPVQYSDLEPGNSIYTGLIIDCRGVEVRPALAPRVLSESGEEIYGNSWVDRDWALANGIAGYVRSIEQARNEVDRIGNNPLIVKAVASKGLQLADVIIPDRSGKILHSLADNLSFLSECRVIMIIE
jgi:hypothetical protein